MSGGAARLGLWTKPARLVWGATTLTTQLELSVADVDLTIRKRVESDARRAQATGGFEAEHLRAVSTRSKGPSPTRSTSPLLDAARSRSTPPGWS